MKISKEEVITLMKDALDIEGSLADNTSMENTPEWDSLGHLSILTSLDQATEGKASSISELGEVSSLDALISILKKENLINES